ncbi:MAG: trans-4-hydroxy-L-proline dehydratase [Anaerolineales bacterium]
MKKSARIEKLQAHSKATRPALNPERAQLITRFYRNIDTKKLSPPKLRALAFSFLLENKTITIEEGELIVGEKGPGPKAAPTYPELCCHTLDDLQLLDQREKIPYRVEQKTREIYQEEIIPFWKGKSLREKIFEQMTPAWKDAYRAGVFTEFMEQRSPGHTVLDDKIYQKGMLDFQIDIQNALEELDFENDPQAMEKKEQLEAMGITAQALIKFGTRYSLLARELADCETDLIRKSELEQIAAICDRIPAHKPRTFQEALQYYWFVHLGVTLELNPWDAFCPGHLDQHLFPYYEKELAQGSLTAEMAEELLQCLWVKFENQPAPPKVGVTAHESSTYTDFVQLNIGGVKKDGSDGVSPVSFMMLDVIETMHQVQPNPSVQISELTPDPFLTRAAEVIREGMGKPDLFNTDLVVEQMIGMGKTVEDARQGGTSGCIETGAFGKEAYILTGYFNLTKVLEISLNRGRDPKTGKQLGPDTGDPRSFKNFDELFSAFEKQLTYFIDLKVEGNHIIERLYAEKMPAPFLSLLIDDCIPRGKDYHNGGPRYDTSYIQGVGLGTMTDALTAIKVHVFQEKNLTMDEMLNALANNFKGQERLRQQLLNRTPRYGNDDDRADDVMCLVFEAYLNAVDGRPNTRGGVYHINFLPTTCHVYFGSMINATPDGRFCGKPVSEGISPVQGADRKGPTAVLNSAAKIDHVRTGGTLLNQKLNPRVVETPGGLKKFTDLIRTYFKLGGHHLQFNIVDQQTLRAAQNDPQSYRNLIVRVAGYSDYFCDLTEALQEEIITRTEHQGL